MRLASRFDRHHSVRCDRLLNNDELMQGIPSVFTGDKYEFRLIFKSLISSTGYMIKGVSRSLPVGVGGVI